MTELTYKDWLYIHEMILFQRMLDHKHRKQLDALDRKVVDNLNDKLEEEERNDRGQDNKMARN
jgi:hypothetical protein